MQVSPFESDVNLNKVASKIRSEFMTTHASSHLIPSFRECDSISKCVTKQLSHVTSDRLPVKQVGYRFSSDT